MGSGLSQKYSNTYGSGSDKYDASEVREDSLEYENKVVIIRKSSGTSNMNENVSLLPEKFAPNEYGNFGKPGKNCRVIKCEDPVSESSEFYEIIGQGGEVRTIPGREGTITKLDDRSQITYRVITTTEDSPAVEINVKKVDTNINGQKIHFIKENADD